MLIKKYGSSCIHNWFTDKLWRNLTKEAKDLHNENLKYLGKKLNKNLESLKSCPCSRM